MQPVNKQALFPIGHVSEKTGVNSVTLRAWERRYGLIKPQRTPKGHRLYSTDDIALIKNILVYLDQGLSISKISDRILHSDTIQQQVSDQGPWADYRQRFIHSISLFDEEVLDAIYNEAMSLYPVEVVTHKLIQPLLQELGERWEVARQLPHETPVAEEHFFSVFIRNKLGARFHHRNIHNRGPRLVLACLPGEKHEFALLLLALAAHARGYRIVLLGADMPLHELALVVAKTQADALVLSGSDSLSCDSLYEDLVTLITNTPKQVYIGGEISDHCEHSFSALNLAFLGSDVGSGLSLISQRLMYTFDD